VRRGDLANRLTSEFIFAARLKVDFQCASGLARGHILSNAKRPAPAHSNAKQRGREKGDAGHSVSMPGTLIRSLVRRRDFPIPARNRAPATRQFRNRTLMEKKVLSKHRCAIS